MKRSAFLWLFACFAAWFVFTSSGYLAAGDEETMFQVTRNLVDRSNPSIGHDSVVVPAQFYPGFLPTRPYTVETTQVSVGREGRVFSPYGISQSLAAVPLYCLARGASGSPGVARMLPQFLSAVWLAGCVALIFAFGCELGFAQWLSLGLAGAFALGTMAWPYVKCWYAEPAAAFWLLLSALCLLRLRREAADRWALLAGVSFGAALTFRVSAAIAALPLTVYAAATLRACAPSWTRRIRLAVLGLTGVAPGLILVLGYNVVRFGRILTISYSESRIGWDTPFVYGLYGLLFSPGKSLFVYSPVLVLSLVGLLVWLQSRPREAWLVGSMFAVFVAFHAPYTFWTGGWNWGPRFLLPAAPFLMLAAGGALQAARSRAIWIAFGVLVALGIVIQAPAVLVDHSREIITQSERGAGFYDRTIRDAAWSPAWRQWPQAMDVMTRFARREAWSEAARSLATFTDIPASDSAAESVQRTEFLRANTPAFWWVQVILSGASPAGGGALALLNLAAVAVAARMTVRSLRNAADAAQR